MGLVLSARGQTGVWELGVVGKQSRGLVRTKSPPISQPWWSCAALTRPFH